MEKATSRYELAQLLVMVAEDLRSLADCLQALSDAGADELTDEPKEVSEEPVKKQPAITLEKVRGILADKSRNGHTAEVRAIIQKYGAERLSDIDPANYPAVIKDAEVL